MKKHMTMELYRSKEDKVILGLFGGIGHEHNIDPWILRAVALVIPWWPVYFLSVLLPSKYTGIEPRLKSKGTAYLLWLVSGFGWLGFHQLYLGKPMKMLIYIPSVGLLGWGCFIDFFTLGSQVDSANNKKEIGHLRYNARQTQDMIANMANVVAQQPQVINNIVMQAPASTPVYANHYENDVVLEEPKKLVAKNRKHQALLDQFSFD